MGRPSGTGATALRELFRANATALEGLFGARVEGTERRGRQARIKTGLGAGLQSEFGAPEWRVVLGVELFDRGG